MKLQKALAVAFLITIVVFGWVLPAHSQLTGVDDAQIVPIPGVGHDYTGSTANMLTEIVSPADGSLSVMLNVPTPKGRKLSLPFSFRYNSNGVLHPFLSPLLGSSQQAQINWLDNKGILGIGGWDYGVPKLSLVAMQYWAGPPAVPGDEGTPYCWADTGYVFQDPDGGRHDLHISASEYEHLPDSKHCGGVGMYLATVATGGDDVHFQAVTSPLVSDTPDPTPVTVADSDGTVYYFAGLTQYQDGYSPANIYYGGLPQYVEDTNGNRITFTQPGLSGGFTATDTAGRTVLSSDGFGSRTKHVNVSGLGQYIIDWASTPVTQWASMQMVGNSLTDQYCPMPGGPPASRAVISSIGLPNGQQFTFQYNGYGLLTKIIYPSGADITYTWGSPIANAYGASYQDSKREAYCQYLIGPPMITHRVVHINGVPVEQQDYSYATTYGDSNMPITWTGKASTVKTTDLVGSVTNQTSYSYGFATARRDPNMMGGTAGQIPVEQSVSYQDGSGHVLKTKTEVYGGFEYLLCSLVTLDNGLTAGDFYNYGPGGVVTDKKEYDYGQISPTSTCYSPSSAVPPIGISPLRETATAYQGFRNTPLFSSSPSIFERPCQVLTYGSGALVAETDEYYDGGAGSPCAAAGVPSVAGAGGSTLTGHDSANYGQTSSAPRGNLTKIVRKCFPLSPNTQPCSDALTTIAYDETGQVVSSVDPNGNATGDSNHHTTYYGYADQFSSGGPASGVTNAYVTSVTYPVTQNGVAHSESFQYGYVDGKLTQYKDENGQVTNQVTTYSYNDPMDRIKRIQYPTGGGETTIDYNDSGPNPSVTVTQAIDSAKDLVNTTIMDGFGRAVQTVVTDSSQGAIYQDTTYDGVGRKLTVSNPYRAKTEATYGVTKYYYDALGRIYQVTNPDSTITSTSYLGRAVFASDEGNGTKSVQHVSQNDVLGRLLSVCEVSSTTLPGSGGSPGNCGQDMAKTGFLTTYHYNGIGGLDSIVQGPLSARSFQYNSLGQITSAYNPESGATTYAYDNNGNVITKTDARGSLVSYCYDSLNRVTSKSYTAQNCSNPPSPATTYTYDVAVDGLPIANPIGRLTKAFTNNTATVSSYDTMGRISPQWQCTPQNCGSSYYRLDYTYDYLGDVLTSATGVGPTLTQTFDGVARLATVTSSWSDANHPATLISGPSGTSGIQYSPFGALSAAVLGNGLSESSSYNARGWLSAKSASSGAAIPSRGSVTINGSEKSIAATPGKGTVTISSSGDRCASGESGQATVKVNTTFTASATWNCGSTVSSIASGLASSLNSSSVVSATSAAGVVSITAKSTGTGSNYSLSVNITSNGATYPFAIRGSGSTLTGGANAQYDSGKVWVAINGQPAVSVPYGQGSTAVSVALALAPAINKAISQFVTATASSNVITLTSTLVGRGTNYTLSAGSSTDKPSQFASPSFTLGTSGSTLTGGGGGPIYDLSMTYTPNGNVYQSIDGVNGTWTYTYDEFNRLLTGNSTSGKCSGVNFTWQYDRFGNRMSQTASGTSQCTAVQPQLSFTSGTNRMDGWSYDAAGNLLNDSIHNYVYDAESRIQSLDNGATTYVYDAGGRRVRKTTGGVSVDFLYDLAGHEIVELGSSGTVNRVEAYAGNRHLATYALGTTYFIHGDWLGTERARSLPDGSVAETCVSYPFGDGLSCTGVDASPMHFTGKEHDNESGLDNFGARYDASGLGRFMTPDWAAKPVSVPYANFGDPQSLNLYAYVRNNPATAIDADGHDSSCWFFSARCEAKAGGTGANDRQGTDNEQYRPHGCTSPGKICGGPEQNNRSIMEVALESNASLAIKTSTTSTTNKDGTVTITTTTTIAAFSRKEGNLGQFLGAATQTNTMTYNPSDTFSVNPGQNGPITPISLDAARSTIGYDAVRQAADVSPDMAYYFARAVGSDIYHHPINYGLHVAGLALPFVDVGEAAEGLITGAEALKTAFDLNKEMQ